MTTLTPEQTQSIADKLAGMTLPSGIGDEHNACSIAAINLALTGKLSDDIPHCMSEVIGKWIIEVQDSAPEDMRNSKRWKSLLPLAAGTGRDLEEARFKLLLDWMWEEVLPTLQPLADESGFGKEWQNMIMLRSQEAIGLTSAIAGDRILTVPDKYSNSAVTCQHASWFAMSAVRTRPDYGWEDLARFVAITASEAKAWDMIDPCDVLQRLIEVTE